MKYVNQINFALAAIAAAAALYAFSQTYFDPVEPPRIVVESPAAGDGVGEAQQGEAERGGIVQPSPRATPPRPAASPSGPRALPSRNRNRGVQPEAGRPTAERPGNAPLRPQQQLGSGSPSNPPESAGAPPDPGGRQPARPPAESRPRPVPPPPRAQPQPEEDEGERESPRSFPQTPEGARRDQNRRGSPSPPPARSSMPEQSPRR